LLDLIVIQSATTRAKSVKRSLAKSIFHEFINSYPENEHVPVGQLKPSPEEEAPPSTENVENIFLVSLELHFAQT